MFSFSKRCAECAVFISIQLKTKQLKYNTYRLYDLFFFFLRNNTRTLDLDGNMVQSEWVNRIKYNSEHTHVKFEAMH